MNIVVRFNVEGLHNWPAAKDMIPQMAFLSSPHRHLFFFEVKKKVGHSDRDVEIIQFKRSLEEYLNKKYYDKKLNLLNFEHRSCEMLAEEIYDQFGCTYVQVLEDNENGAEIF